jgi:hypothetical protein
MAEPGPAEPDRGAAPAVGADRYALVLDETFDGGTLDTGVWFPHYLPHWTSREASAARWSIVDGALRLRVEADQPPWAPGLEGGMRVSALQTGTWSGAVGSTLGQHRTNDAAVVRESLALRLLLPRYGRLELTAQVSDDPSAMGALWLIGYEDVAGRSAEICVFEIFGRDVRTEDDGTCRTGVGIGLHPHGDPGITDDFTVEHLPIDAREPHTYAVDWEPGRTTFLVDGDVVRDLDQAPTYPMQLMLTQYAFPGDGSDEVPGPFPKEMVVHRVRYLRRTDLGPPEQEPGPAAPG